MMVLQAATQLTPALLAQILTDDGALEAGRVTQVDRGTDSFNKGYVSNVASLTVMYSADAAGKLPDRLFLKMSRPDVHPELLMRGWHEVEFYKAMTQLAPGWGLPHCYQALAEENGPSHILMDDLSVTHFQKPLPIPPSNRHCEMIVQSLADLHALWWNHSRLGNGLGERLTQAQSLESRQRLESTLPDFF